jgi:hypothetical protein
MTGWLVLSVLSSNYVDWLELAAKGGGATFVPHCLFDESLSWSPRLTIAIFWRCYQLLRKPYNVSRITCLSCPGSAFWMQSDSAHGSLFGRPDLD